MPTVKTAISVPKPLFQEFDRLSRRLRVPRSRLFVQAAEEFLQRHTADEITKQLNRVYAKGETEEDRAIRHAAMYGFSKLVEGTW